jgi:hypothetical protein
MTNGIHCELAMSTVRILNTNVSLAVKQIVDPVH